LDAGAELNKNSTPLFRILYSRTCAIRHLSFSTSDKNLWSQSISVN